MSFTPGPWKAWGQFIVSTHYTSEVVIGTFTGNYDMPESEVEANRNLAAHAPQLLAELEKVMGKAYKQNWNDQYPELVAEVEAVISMARGES